MALDPITAVLTVGSQLIDRLWPDAATAAQAKLDLLKLQQSGDLASMTAEAGLMTAQAGIDQVEAGSSNMFIAGWRPMVGWACAIGVAFQFVLQPVIGSIFVLFGSHMILPVLDTGTLMPLLMSMLGIGAMRTYEKVTGTANKEPGH